MEGHEWNVLRTCFIQVLEDTAFMFAETDAGDGVDTDALPDSGEDAVSETEGDSVESDAPEVNFQMVEISFTGPVSGSLAIECDGRFMTSLAANVLGLDEEDLSEEADKIDALKELVNIICGNFITSLGGSRAVFDLTIPTIRTTGSTGKLRDEMEKAGSFDVDGNQVTLALRMAS